MLLQLGLQLVLPASFLFMLWKNRHTDRLQWWLETAVLGLGMLFVILVARWDVTSWYLRILLPVAFILVAVGSYRRIEFHPEQRTGLAFLNDNALNLVLALLLGVLNMSVLWGIRTPPDAVNLEYPLRNGTFYVGGGGVSRWINGHVAAPPQDYALDVVALNGFGNRGTILNSPELESYEIFGTAVYSPCSGTVTVAVDGQPDHRPPSRDSSSPAGNHVVIACKDVELLLAHLKRGSLRVSRGNTVHAGQALGRVGNSGNTTQPHLHIHAERGGKADTILDGEGVPITFGGRFLVRNSTF